MQNHIEPHCNKACRNSSKKKNKPLFFSPYILFLTAGKITTFSINRKQNGTFPKPEHKTEHIPLSSEPLSCNPPEQNLDVIVFSRSGMIEKAPF